VGQRGSRVESRSPARTEAGSLTWIRPVLGYLTAAEARIGSTSQARIFLLKFPQVAALWPVLCAGSGVERFLKGRWARLALVLYAAKCYWPGVTQADLQQVTERAGRAGLATGCNTVTYLGSLLFTDDDLVLCLFHGPSRAAVIQASDRLGIPRERLMDSAWLGPGLPLQQEAPPVRHPPAAERGPGVPRTATEALE